MRVLVIEDDPAIAGYLDKSLAAEGYEVEVRSDGESGLRAALNETFDLLIVDRMLPQKDGLSIVTELRRRDLASPVLFLSALAGIDDRVQGLERGGDDYLVKPFALPELLARVRALTRRSRGVNSNRLECEGLVLDLVERTATYRGRDLDLVQKEFQILTLFARQPGTLVTKRMLLEQIWNFSFDPRTSVVETHISRLRAKLERQGAGSLLRTVRGEGYVLGADPSPAG